jgi:hypothetical protein
MSVEGLSIGAASANVGQRHMELLGIREVEEEEIMPTPRSTWECHSNRILQCGTLHDPSIPVTRPKTFPNVPLNVPFVLLTSVLLIMLYALRMLLAVIGAKQHQIWSYSAAVWQAIVTLFIRNGPIMMETIEKVLSLSKSSAPPVDQLACLESLVLEGQRQRHRRTFAP